jgi:hypothetical protein
MNSSVGLDIGGANLKFATSSGEGGIKYFPMWKKWKKLKDELEKIKAKFRPERVGVVITAELADVFRSKREGFVFVSKTVKKAFSDSEIYYLDLNGNLKKRISNPRDFIASNWLASAKFLLESYKNFIFADMGSTTTDLIPITTKIVAGKTDYERLKRGELLYLGVLRTPAFYILPEFNVPLVPEYFAIAADAFVVTGDINPREYSCETPDRGRKDVASCMLRLARTLCCDLEEMDSSHIRRLAKALRSKTIERVERAMKFLSERHELQEVVGCGIGEFILKEATEKASLRYVSLAEKYGEASKFFPAYAMARFVEEV